LNLITVLEIQIRSRLDFTVLLSTSLRNLGTAHQVKLWRGSGQIRIRYVSSSFSVPK